jgi:hypothetical protein
VPGSPALNFDQAYAIDSDAGTVRVVVSGLNSGNTGYYLLTAYLPEPTSLLWLTLFAKLVISRR